MLKPQLKEPFNTLEHEMVYTMMAGHKNWRPDLSNILRSARASGLKRWRNDCSCGFAMLEWE